MESAIAPEFRTRGRRGCYRRPVTTPEPDQGSRTFTIETCLGKGGFGEVYLAAMETAGGLKKTVALKVLRLGLDPEGQAVERLRDEGRLLAGLEHPVILGVHDVSMVNGRVALITEYVEGQDLDGCFAKPDPMQPRALLQAIGEVANALDAAWRNLDLVHRDIKPANIRIGTHGQVKLLDFGIARSDTSAREAKTATNMMVGSLPYMAPERFIDTTPSPAGDVFALGCCLFEGLAGQRLYEDVTPPMMAGYAMSPERYVDFLESRLKTLPSSVPDAVWDLLLDCLEHDLDKRPNAGALGERCERMADRMDGPTLKRWARGRPWPEAHSEEGGLVGQTLSDSTLARPVPEAAPQPAEPVTAPTELIAEPPPPPLEGTGSYPSTVTVAVVGASSAFAAGGAVLLVVALLAAVWASGVLSPAAVDTEPPAVADVETDQPTDDVEAQPPEPDDDSEPVRASPAKRKPTPADEPKAEPAPEVESAPEPEAKPPPERPEVAPPKAAAPTSTFAVQGKTSAMLRIGGQDRTPGSVPAGTHDIVADFGDGLQVTGTAECPPGGSCTIKCNGMMQTCSSSASN